MPYVRISLDEFEEKDLVEYLEELGYLVSKTDPPQDNQSLATKLFEYFRGDNSTPGFVKDYVYENAGRIL